MSRHLLTRVGQSSTEAFVLSLSSFSDFLESLFCPTSDLQASRNFSPYLTNFNQFQSFFTIFMSNFNQFQSIYTISKVWDFLFLFFLFACKACLQKRSDTYCHRLREF